MGHVRDVAGSWRTPARRSGVNDRRQLAHAEQVLRTRINERVDGARGHHVGPGPDLRRRRRRTRGRGVAAAGHDLEGPLRHRARGDRSGRTRCCATSRWVRTRTVATVEATHARIGADASVASFVVLSPAPIVATGEIVTPLSQPLSLGPPVHLYAGAVESLAKRRLVIVTGRCHPALAARRGRQTRR